MSNELGLEVFGEDPPPLPTAMTLVQVILVPVDFSITNLKNDEEVIEGVGWCLADSVGGESDRHSHRGQIYRRAGEDEDWSNFVDDVIYVYVPEIELPKFERIYL